MSKPFQPPDAELVAKLRARAERRLSREEFAAYVNAPKSDEERAEMGSLLDWFTRRYPTPAERLAWARRAYTRWVCAVPSEATRRRSAAP